MFKVEYNAEGDISMSGNLLILKIKNMLFKKASSLTQFTFIVFSQQIFEVYKSECKRIVQYHGVLQLKGTLNLLISQMRKLKSRNLMICPRSHII